MKRISFVGLVLLLLTAASALNAWGQKVSVDFDKEANFAAYKTYAWTTGTAAQNPLMGQRITDGIDKQLAAKGLQKVDASANPDLAVLYHAAVGTETQLNTINTGGYGWGYRWGGGMGRSTTTVEKIPVGQLTVDIGDAKTKKLLWLGNARDTLSDKPEKNEKKINSALDKMFKKFPPPVKK
jgi:Domain of unknown function (DUF4136)